VRPAADGGEVAFSDSAGGLLTNTGLLPFRIFDRLIDGAKAFEVLL